MNRNQAANALRQWDERGRYVFARQDLAKLFPTDSPKTLAAGLGRLVQAGLLQRVCRGVYVNPHARCFDRYVLERITVIVRRGEYSYVSLESMLAEYGIISQIPVDRLTVMTTGRKGLCATPYGVIEFTHTHRQPASLLAGTIWIENRPLRVATAGTAWRDLKRVGRNLHLVDVTELPDA